MIQMLEIRTGSAIWEIDGTILRFQRLKKAGDEEVESRINVWFLIKSVCFRRCIICFTVR